MRLKIPLAFNCHEQKDGAWLERAEKAASWVKVAEPNSRPLSIADLGCGDQKLKAVLEKSCKNPITYKGYDLCPQSDQVIPLDLSKSVPAEHYDMIFCLGVIEYLADPFEFFQKVRPQSNHFIASYVISDSKAYKHEDTLKRGWKTHLSQKEISDLLTKAGFRILDTQIVNRGKTGLWLAQGNTTSL